ncbi:MULTISPECIES: hypothetical protein [unclassified Pantoea]|uniref:hypothetical protein n=1 Tax=unclassified Pantoea TaxID=2630326 RepID=UPI001232BBBD|nr:MULTISPECIES: hypothetical protein [unclassified Pantoea]KAA5932327.1 hypothetical protein F3I59_04680 [Pantoea sp. VH_8]KAA5937388.1 hypothetical protein F3I58_04710 [Pantoea sp. VH_4]
MFNIRDLIRVYMNEAGAGDQSGGGESQQSGAEGQPQSTSTNLLGGEGGQQQQAAEPFLSALPEEGDAEGWGNVWSKLGRPENAEGYELPVPEGDSGEFAGAASSKMFELGVSKKQAQGIAEWYNSQQALAIEQVHQQREQQATENIAAIRKEWGNNFDSNVAVANKAISAYLAPEAIQALKESGLGSNPHFVKAFHKIGQSLSEAKVINGEPSQSGPKSTEDIFYGSN